MLISTEAIAHILYTFRQEKTQYWKYLWNFQKEGEKQSVLLSLNGPQYHIAKTRHHPTHTQRSTTEQPTQVGIVVVSLIFTWLLFLGMCERRKILNAMVGLCQQISLSVNKCMKSYSICQDTCHWCSCNAKALMVPCLQSWWSLASKAYICYLILTAPLFMS